MMGATGIFGGSFDPVHVAHLALAERVRRDRALSRVLLVPALKPPHKPSAPLAPGHHRLRMLELATEHRPGLEASGIELERDGPSYTLLTVRQLRRDLGPDERLFLMVGGDMLADLPGWWHADELVREVDIIPVARPGSPLEAGLNAVAAAFGTGVARRTRDLAVEMPLMDVSASEIRARLRSGNPISGLVPAPVEDYIRHHGLYVAG
jgi:nicotinate-nucleotide adenylyltransferase